MISRDEALRLSEDHFPYGLDRLSKALSVRVERSDIGNVDGWCYHLPDGGRVVRLNTSTSRERQRFTLAHELAHFIIGARRDEMTLFLDVYNPRSREERDADELASKLLLPSRRVIEIIGTHAVDYPAIKELMRKARVSDIVVALRLAKSGEEFGLTNPRIVWFEGSQIKSVLPKERPLNPSAAISLFDQASADPDRTARRKGKDGRMIIAVALPNENYPTLFYYRADPIMAGSSPKRREQKALEEVLFNDDERFRCSLNGCIGGNRHKLINMELWEQVDFVIQRFCNSYVERPAEHINKITSQECYEWLCNKLEGLR